MALNDIEQLNQPLELPCGLVLKNRIVKSAMSDSLGDGCGNPTDAQLRLYQRWAAGGASALMIGEVQVSPYYAEKPGNLVLSVDSDHALFKSLAHNGSINNTQIWPQLSHAGAMANPPISTPKGPSAINIPGLCCEALTAEEIHRLPSEFAQAALTAQGFGFGGVEIHAAHGFLLSQFLSPLFNQRDDEYGGSIESRMRILIEVVDAVRKAVGDSFAIVVKLNATDQQTGGLVEKEALSVVSALNDTSIDLLDISGGTYFPGAKSASDAQTSGPYFLDFARRARNHTDKALMVTGGFKTIDQAANAISSGDADVIGLARALVLDPDLPNHWFQNQQRNLEFPKFSSSPAGGVTAWYTMRLTLLGQDRENAEEENERPDLNAVVSSYEARDEARVALWNDRFVRADSGKV